MLTTSLTPNSSKARYSPDANRAIEAYNSSCNTKGG
ncbi:Uncharacterised protein [Vibrio cholerae]|nr:Uncharacterised protein [Vibrio cholerae]